MNQTPNYALNQWEPGDQVLRADFNADNAKLDAALVSHAALLAGKGNCRVETSSYIGRTSQDRLGLSRTFTFSKRPALVLIFGASCLFLISGISDSGLFIGGYDAVHNEIHIASQTVTWNGNSATISNSARQICMDKADAQYQVVAWIPEDGEE